MSEEFLFGQGLLEIPPINHRAGAQAQRPRLRIRIDAGRVGREHPFAEAEEVLRLEFHVLNVDAVARVAPDDLADCQPAPDEVERLDRKSTRLNSSHANTSYA